MSAFLTVAGFFLLLAVVVFWMVNSSQKEQKKQLEQLRNLWGQKRKKEISGEKKEKLSGIIKRSETMMQKKPEVFVVDDITWNDLNLDRIFDIVDHTVSACGEEYLYEALRMPVIDKKIWEERENLAALFSAKKEVREAVQKAISGIGKEKENPPMEDLRQLMQAKPEKCGNYVLLSGIAVLGICLLFLVPPLGVLVLFASMTGNGLVHAKKSREIEGSMKAMGCMLRLSQAAKQLCKEKIPEIQSYQECLEKNAKQLQKVTRKCATLVNTKETQGGAANMLFAYFHTFFLLDLLEYHAVIQTVIKYEENIRFLAQNIGMLDFALSIASFRESIPYFCIPEFLDGKRAGCRIDVEEMYHPLLTDPVANSLYAEGGILITGSNASGKSTFMKNMAVNTILAQALHTSLSRRYRGVLCKVMTSMALRDNLEQGESYFVVEVKSLKRILEESQKREPLLCVIDEVLRGTNTTERIAASESVLRALRKANVLCLAATHDVELTYLLEELYTNYHFEEKITENQICFSYHLEKGRAKGKNAIALLEKLGVDSEIVQYAKRRAADFEKNGKW